MNAINSVWEWKILGDEIHSKHLSGKG